MLPLADDLSNAAPDNLTAQRQTRHPAKFYTRFFYHLHYLFSLLNGFCQWLFYKYMFAFAYGHFAEFKMVVGGGHNIHGIAGGY